MRNSFREIIRSSWSKDLLVSIWCILRAICFEIRYTEECQSVFVLRSR